MKTDIEIAQENKMEKISVIADKLGLTEDEYECYGKYKAKINYEEVLERLKCKPDAKVIWTTAVTPTPAGEGKTTVSISLADSLAYLGKKPILALREPSLGPVFGVKGGACGGGYSQIMPMDEINLHFTSDIHAATTANNLIAAVIDNHIYQGNELNIDPNRVIWKRCLDLCDRSLREVTIGQGPKSNGIERKDGFNITVASEIAAITDLATDIEDLRNRIAKISVAYTYDGKLITVDDLGCTGSIVLLLKDAIKPNLVQTLYHTPALISGYCFANIAAGNSSILASKLGVKLGDYLISEGGFASDLGFAKGMELMCPLAGIKPSCAVIVATIKALKMHGGVAKENLKEENLEALKAGIPNLEKHIENAKAYGIPYVIALNKFLSDTDAEVQLLLNWAKENGHEIALATAVVDGPVGGVDLANKVIAACEEENNYHLLTNDTMTLEEKIEKMATTLYGADGVDYTDEAKAQLAEIYTGGYDKLFPCMAKTQNSLSDDPKVLGRPKGFRVTVKELRLNSGAGFIVVLLGKILTMPGLPKVPNTSKIDYRDGKVIGLF